MGTLTQVVITNILNYLIKDDNFAYSFGNCIQAIFDISPPDFGTEDPLEDVIDRIIEYCGDDTLGKNIPGLRTSLIKLLKDKDFLALTRVLRILHDLFDYSKARVINYLKKFQFQTRFNEGSYSPWVDVRKTSTAIREGLDPRRMSIFAKLNYEQRCLLRGLNPAEIDVISNFSPIGINVLSRIIHLSREERVMIFSLDKNESSLFRDFGFSRINFLANLEITKRNILLELSASDRWTMRHNSEEVSRFLRSRGIDEEEWRDLLGAIIRMKSKRLGTLRELVDRESAMIRSMNEESADLAGSVCDLSVEERDRYFNLSRTQLDVLKNLNQDQRNVIMTFQDESPSLNEVLDVANSLNSQQRDVILSLRQRDIQMMLSQIQQISLKDQEIITNFSVLTPEEENAILELDHAQRQVLSKAYILGYDGLCMIRKLGPELTYQVFGSYSERRRRYQKLSVIQMALMRKLDNVNQVSVYLDTTEITRLFEIMEYGTHTLLNLSWRGRDLLQRLAQLDQRTIDFVIGLSTGHMNTLTKNDRLIGTEIFSELENLNNKEAKVLINLSVSQREYLSKHEDLSWPYTPLFNEKEYEVLINLSEEGNRVLSKIIPLSSRERSQLGIEDETFLRRMNKMELELFSALTADEMRTLSTVMVWHGEEDLVFNILEMDFEDLPHEKTEQIKTFLRNIPDRISTTGYDKVFKLFASTIETLRLSGTITDDFISIITPLIENMYGKDLSIIFQLHLLNYSMNDSRSLESLLVPLIVNNEQDISITYHTNEIHTIEDVQFMRWILSQQFDLNGGLFYEFAVAGLSGFPVHMTGQEFDILLSKSTSQRDGIQHERVLNGFRHILRADNYLLASSFFLASGQGESSVIRSLILALTPNDCFQLFNTPINRIVLDEISSTSTSLGYTHILIDGRFPAPNVLEVSLYYNSGDPLPFLEMLEESQLWKLFEKRAYLLLRLIAHNYQIELFELCRKFAPLNQLISAHRVSIFESLMKDLKFHNVYFPIDPYMRIAGIIRILGYSGSFIGKETYISMVTEYMLYLQGRVSKEGLKIILDSFVSEDVNRDDLIRSLRNRLRSDLYKFLKNNRDRRCTFSRKKRDAGIICADSENTEEIMSEEEKRSVEKTFDISMNESQSEILKLYEELLEYSTRQFQGKKVDPRVKRALMLKIRNVHLESIDQRIADIVELMKNNQGNQKIIDTFLKQFGIVNRINEVASTLGLTFTVFLVGKHLMHGDSKNLGYDALNLWVMPKIGEEITEKLTNLAMTKGFAPIIGTAIGNLAGFIGLGQGLLAQRNAIDPIDAKIADLNVVTNSVFIAANIPAVTNQIMSNLGTEISVIGELTNSLGLALSVAVIIKSYFKSLDLEVERYAEHISLSDQEEQSLYWRLFWDETIPDNLRIDLTAKDMYIRYLRNYLHRFKDKYNQIALSLPNFLIIDKKCIANTGLRLKTRIPRGAHYCMGCSLGEKNTSYAIDFSQKVYARNVFSRKHVHHRSRLLPNKLEGYDMVCGPSANDAIEHHVHSNIPQPCPPDSVHRDTKWIIEMKELFIPSRTDDDCSNIVSFRKHEPSNYSNIFFLVFQDASIVLSGGNSMDMIFYGDNISITDPDSSTQIPKNRYYFETELRECSIRKEGYNLFYLTAKEFKCDLGSRTNNQHNIVVIRNNFVDSNNVHSIFGSRNRESIEANFAGYVDGKGGGDIIQATERTIVKGYFNDSITGNCRVLLPFNVNDIGSLIVGTLMSVYNKKNESIKVDTNMTLLTTDGYLLTPIRSSNITHKVTHVHIRKTLKNEIILENELATMRDIKIPNCTLVKQLLSANYDIILTEVGRNIFLTDKNHHEYYWESSDEDGNLYLFKKSFVNVTISKANGILDFQNLKMNFKKEFIHSNSNYRVEISIGGLRVILLPNYRNVTFTFDGKKYHKLEYNEIARDWCSHGFRVVDRIMVNGTDIHDYLNCFQFDSNKILFLKLENDLILVSGKQVLTILKYYSLLHRRKEFSLKLNDRIIEPQIFQERADNPYKLIYYNVSNSGLRVYHNQPVDKHHIGFIDLKDKSIKEFEMTMNGHNILLMYRNLTLVRIENWANYQPGRELMFAFNDSFLPNVKCLISNCKPNDIIGEFQTSRNRITNSRSKRQVFRNLQNPSQIQFHSETALITHSDESKYTHFGKTLDYTAPNANLIFVLLQRFLDEKYPLPKSQGISPVVTLASVIDLIEEYERVLNNTARKFDMKLKNVNSFQLYSDITKLVKMENYKDIPNVMYLAGKKLYPRDEKWLMNIKNYIQQLINNVRLYV